MRNNLWDWQSLDVTDGPGTRFTEFCDALEVKNGVSAPTAGWGVDHAVAAWGAYWRNTYYDDGRSHFFDFRHWCLCDFCNSLRNKRCGVRYSFIGEIYVLTLALI